MQATAYRDDWDVPLFERELNPELTPRVRAVMEAAKHLVCARFTFLVGRTFLYIKAKFAFLQIKRLIDLRNMMKWNIYLLMLYLGEVRTLKAQQQQIEQILTL